MQSNYSPNGEYDYDTLVSVVLTASLSVVRSLNFPDHPQSITDALAELDRAIKAFYPETFGPLPFSSHFETQQKTAPITERLTVLREL